MIVRKQYHNKEVLEKLMKASIDAQELKKWDVYDRVLVVREVQLSYR